MTDTVSRLESLFDNWDVLKLLSGPYDTCGAYLSIQSGAGGTEAQDWAEMLQRMYVRWAQVDQTLSSRFVVPALQTQGFTCKVQESVAGEEAGIKSATLEIDGRCHTDHWYYKRQNFVLGMRTGIF